MKNELEKFYCGKKILITGGRGYLGSNLTSLLKDIDCHIVRLGKSEEPPKERKGTAEIEDIVCDIRESEVWENVLDGIDIVFHFAAQTSVYVADERSVDDLKINVLPMVQLLETCKRNNCKPIILFAGTVTETGMPIKLPVDESHPDKPVTTYDLHKLMAENYLKYFSERGIVKGAILRLANVYGPGPKSSSADRGILNVMIRKALQGEDLTLYGKGDNLRDYIYVTDVVNAFLMAAKRVEALNGQHFVIGTGEGYTLQEAFSLVTECVKRKAGIDVKIVNVDSPTSQSAIESRNFVADPKKFIDITGCKPGINLIKGIDQTIEYLSQKQPALSQSD